MSEVSEIQGYSIKDVQARNSISDMQTNGYVVIGDSYLCGQNANGDGAYCSNNWGVFLKQLLGIEDNDFFQFGEGASGFYQTGNQGHTFLELLQANIDSITDKSTIKNIIVCGGCNDVNASSQSEIEDCMKNFIDYCKVHFENAQIYVGLIGGYNNPDLTSTSRNKLKNRVYSAYLNCNKYGAIYLDGVEGIMQDYTENYSSDKVHPSLTGQKALASAIYQCLKGGSVTIFKEMNPVGLPTTDDVASNTVWVHEKQIDNRILVNFNGYMDLSHYATKGSLILNFPDVTFRYLRKSQNYFQEHTLTARLLDIADTKEVTITGRFGMNESGGFYLIFDIPTLNADDYQRLILNNQKIILDAMMY